MKIFSKWVLVFLISLATVTNVPGRAASSGKAQSASRQVAQLIKAQKVIRDLNADFILTVPGAGPSGRSLEARGKVWLASGRRYRVQYTAPEEQTLVSDGQKRWLYLKKINQVQVQALPPAGAPNEFFLELGGGLPALLARCRVKPKVLVKPGVSELQLTPLPGESLNFTSAVLKLSGPDWLPMHVSVEADRRVEVELSGVRVHKKGEPGPGLDEGLFHFVPPPGAEVIDMMWN